MSWSGKQCALVLFVINFPVWLICIYGALTHKDVREYQSTFSFQETNCSVQGVVDHGRTPCKYMVDVYYQGYEKMRVKYGAQPAHRSVHSHHPCIEVVVRYSDLKGITRNGTLYQNATLLLDKGQHCSFADCGPDEDTTKEQVQANLYRLSKASVIKCYYNTKDYSQAILKKITFSQVLSSVWLVGLVVLMGCVGALVALLSVLVVLVKVMVEKCTCNLDKVQGKLEVLIKERYITLTTDESA